MHKVSHQIFIFCACAVQVVGLYLHIHVAHKMIVYVLTQKT